MAHNFFDPNVTTDIKARDVAQIPYKEGQFLMTSDTNSIYYDFAEGRRRLTDIIELDTEAQRQAILVPVSKFYFVKETCHFWRHLNGLWVDLSVISASIGTKPYVKKFSASEWNEGRITIPALEHKQELADGDVLAKVYLLLNGAYSDQCFAAMDTTVSVGQDKSVILSYDGSPYSGRVILIG